MNKDEALKLALEALSPWMDTDADHTEQHAAYYAIKQALAAPVQEPVATLFGSLPVYDTTPPAAQQEPIAQAWAEGYRAGIDDERTSEANIGIAGMDMKVEPARNNPYHTTPPKQPAPVPTSWMEMVTANLVREGVNKHKARELAEHFYTTPPAAQRQWAGLTPTERKQIEKRYVFVEDAIRLTEAKLKEKNA